MPVSSVHITDWRKQLQLNTRRTGLVIISFILIYVGIGLLIDLYIGSARYPKAHLNQLLGAYLTGQLTPIATFITAAIAAISLWVTFTFHDRLMLLGTEYREITPQTAQSLPETQLYNVVEEMKVAASLAYMPKVYLIEADYMNAFASGYSEKSAMVAITKGLLEKLDRVELQAVMAHEISHIRHGDIKLTLMASILSNLTLMMLDMLFYTSLFSRRDEDNRSRNQLFIVIMILRWVLPLITVLLTLYLSRTREYMADAGCVELTRENEPLAKALLKIQGDYQTNADLYSQISSNTAHESIRKQAYIFDPAQAGIAASNALSDAFSTHHSVEKRLVALGFKEPK